MADSVSSQGHRINDMKVYKTIKNLKKMKATTENIVSFVENNSYFNVRDRKELSFTTRRYGNGAYSTHSHLDVREAVDIGEKLKKEFNNVEYSITTCDEWVSIYISITEEEK